MASPSQCSFLPEDYLVAKQQRRSNFVCAFLFLVVMGAIGSAFFTTERMMKQIEDQHRAVDSKYTDAAKLIDQLKDMQSKQQQVAARAQLTASLLEKVPRSNLLAEFTNNLPAGTSLTDVALEAKLRPKAAEVKQNPLELAKARAAANKASQAAAASKDKNKAAAAAPEPDKKAPPPPEPRIYDVAIKLSGLAGSDVQVAQFISKLGQSPLFSEVNLVISEQHEDEGRQLRKFQLELKLSPTASVDPTAPAPKLTGSAKTLTLSTTAETPAK